MLTVIEPGLLTTIQDAGRPDWTHLGVPIGGACDPWSLAVANLLAGNDPDTPGIEMTLVGATFAVGRATTIGLAGADMGGVVRETDRRLVPGRSYRLHAGTTIAFGGDRESQGGVRAYLAVAGGIDVPLVLGSASTALGAGFGGFEGRRLQVGDVLRPAAASGATRGAPDGEPTRTVDERAGRSDVVWPALPEDPIVGAGADAPIRLLRGPAGGIDTIVAAEWRIALASDRVGLRLEGPAVAPTVGPELLSHGVVRGSVQVPPSGAPIILLADHQTTGGYPIAAVAISADHPRLGQLRPGAIVRFVETTIDEARRALAEQRSALARGAAAMSDEAGGWDELWQSAGG